jgi:hypothetical protein
MKRGALRAMADKAVALRTIEELLDYAILESAQLGLPTMVQLLHMARLELKSSHISKRRGSPRSGAARHLFTMKRLSCCIGIA